MFKKKVITDRFEIDAGKIFNSFNEYGGLIILLGCKFNAFQLYWDYSDLIDIASGISKII